MKTKKDIPLFLIGLLQTIIIFAASAILAIYVDKIFPMYKHLLSIFILFSTMSFSTVIVPRITGVSGVIGSKYNPRVERVKKDFKGIEKDFLIATIFILAMVLLFYFLVP